MLKVEFVKIYFASCQKYWRMYEHNPLKMWRIKMHDFKKHQKWVALNALNGQQNPTWNIQKCG
jgi:hypothetical protein